MNDKIKAISASIIERFSDGFQLSDLPGSIADAMAGVEAIGELGGSKKKEAVVYIIGEVIDATDTPWLPDALTDPIIKAFVPSMVDKLFEAASGAFGFGKSDGGLA